MPGLNDVARKEASEMKDTGQETFPSGQVLAAATSTDLYNFDFTAFWSVTHLLSVIQQGRWAKLTYSGSFCFRCWSFPLLVSTKPFCKEKRLLSQSPFLQQFTPIPSKAQ